MFIPFVRAVARKRIMTDTMTFRVLMMKKKIKK